MGFKVKIEANETIQLGLETVETITFNTDTPNDSNARSTDLGMELTITGKIRANVAGVADETVKLPVWALVPAENAKCYGKVTVDVISGGKEVRQIIMDTAYVVSYQETFGDESGVGTFTLQLRQKKDMNSNVQYQGGFDY
jgi:hypothetical protein